MGDQPPGGCRGPPGAGTILSAVRKQKRINRKAKAWATSDAEERARLYLSMRDHLNEVANLLGGDAEAGEALGLRAVARQFGGLTAAMYRAKALRSVCCRAALQFGDCKGHAE